jgi:hypothetical protein
VLAYFEAVAGDRAVAADALPSLAASWSGTQRDPNWLMGLAWLCRTSGVLEDLDSAAFLLEVGRPHASRSIFTAAGTITLGVLGMWLAEVAVLTGQLSEAADLLEGENRHTAGPMTPERDQRPSHGVFRREGQVWLVRFAGVDARVRDTKGMADLAVLLARPGVEVHVAELVGAASALGPSGSAQPVLDETALSAYRKRLRDLAAEEDDADTTGDSARSARARQEREAIADQLAADLGIGGAARTTPDWVERARKAVRRRIDASLKRIEVEHPAAGRHLRRSVRTGAFCAYDPAEPVHWED